ncbi:uncharacterized protein LOC125237927 [Leguminivora glycinivorella]|uniref:uncharacterized protein LOC125237927 n=1 Tax=Leguminivora glycinivorella TaxID=1035111 RepID=UPI00200DFEB9|nr:uncharacterized protein LOC125237927 [Leguminivora glycinivorella]
MHKLLWFVVVIALLFIHVEAGGDADNSAEQAPLDNEPEPKDHKLNDKDGDGDANEENNIEQHEQDVEQPKQKNDDVEEHPQQPASNEEEQHEETYDVQNNQREYKPPINTNRGLDFEPMKPDVIKSRGLKCVPGRTVVRMERKQQMNQDDSDELDDESYRRTHMNWQEDKTKEDCKICTCSIEGKDEYCSGRPARNLNECLVMAKLSDELNSHMPFSHERELSNMIRRHSAQKGRRGPSCIPYVSEYSDCSDYTTCRGCNQCRCSAEGEWVCVKKKNTCSDDNELEIFDDGTEDNLVGNILQDLAEQEKNERSKIHPTHLAPMPEKRQRPTPPAPVLGYLIAVLQ